MREDGALLQEQPGRGLPTLPTLVAYERPRRNIGFHFVDQVAREAKSLAGIDAITANSYTVRSIINPQRCSPERIDVVTSAKLYAERLP
jgi:penicillin-binding protein 1A